MAFLAPAAIGRARTSQALIPASLCREPTTTHVRVTHPRRRRRGVERACANPSPAAGASARGDKSVVPDRLRAQIEDYLRNAAEDAEPSPLSYKALDRAGRSDLIEPIMKAGGYALVSAELGVRVGPPSDELLASNTPTAAARLLPSVYETPGPLALGAGKEARLNAPLSMGKSTASNVPGSSRAPYTQPEPVLTPEQMAEISNSIVDIKDEPVPPGERFTFTPAMKASALALAILCAAAFGNASNEALPVDVHEKLEGIAAVALFAHIGLAAATAFRLAAQRGRGRVLWTAKVLLCGVAAVAHLRELGPLDSGAGESSAAR